jgi:hypothetical protein
LPSRSIERAKTADLLDGHCFSVRVEQGRLSIARALQRGADCVIETDPGTLRALVFGDRKLRDAPLQLRGDQHLGRAFFGSSVGPERAARAPLRASAVDFDDSRHRTLG